MRAKCGWKRRRRRRRSLMGRVAERSTGVKRDDSCTSPFYKNMSQDRLSSLQIDRLRLKKKKKKREISDGNWQARGIAVGDSQSIFWEPADRGKSN